MTDVSSFKNIICGLADAGCGGHPSGTSSAKAYCYCLGAPPFNYNCSKIAEAEAALVCQRKEVVHLQLCDACRT